MHLLSSPYLEDPLSRSSVRRYQLPLQGVSKVLSQRVLLTWILPSQRPSAPLAWQSASFTRVRLRRRAKAFSGLSLRMLVENVHHSCPLPAPQDFLQYWLSLRPCSVVCNNLLSSLPSFVPPSFLPSFILETDSYCVPQERWEASVTG